MSQPPDRSPATGDIDALIALCVAGDGRAAGALPLPASGRVRELCDQIIALRGRIALLEAEVDRLHARSPSLSAALASPPSRPR
jgi:hypothetical protein